MKARISKERAFSEFYKSRIIEIPIELEINKDEDHFARHVNTQKFKITPAYEPLVIQAYKEVV